jgi:hypothetical protein
MPILAKLIWAAGAVQLAIVAGNFFLPRKLQVRENLARVTPMIRSVFVVHWAYIVLVLAIFSAICFFYAQELAGGSGLGRFLAAAMAIFWAPRIPIQLFVYDAELRRRHRLGDVAMVSAVAYCVAVFGAAALRIGA